MMLTPRPLKGDASIVQACEKNLKDWLRNLHVTIQYSQHGPSIHFAVQRVLYLHRAVLRMLFLTYTIYLHRPRATWSISNALVDLGLINASQGILTLAAPET